METLISFLNEDKNKVLLYKLAMSNEDLKEEMQKSNFWSGGNFIVEKCSCVGSILVFIEIMNVKFFCLVLNRHKRSRDSH